ncbi:putative nuclease HARBI1, partial [Aphis gossypii]
VITALRFFAAGSYQLDVGENRHTSISQASVSRVIEEVTNAITNPAIFNQFVKFPNNFNELDDVRTGFFSKYKLQGVIGAIDCTHIAITPPKKDDPIYPENIYVNRKGYHSINTQLICDANLHILNVSARWPGSTHDTHIWNDSVVKQFITDLHGRGFTSYFLIGDSGYPLRPWLLTPFLNAEPNTPEYRFNKTFCHARSCIERCNGVLKMRFRCLLKHRTLHYSPSKASKIINACVVLHNLCISENVPIIDGDNDEVADLELGLYHFPMEEHNDDVPNRQNQELIAGQRFRQNIVNRLFTD